MSNPHDPSQPDQGQQQWGQPAQSQPARIDWQSDPARPDQAPWQGPAAFAPPASPQQESPQHESPQQESTRQESPQEESPEAPQQFTPPPGHDQPWVSAGTAQTAQEVAEHWQSSQEAAQGAPPAPYPAPSAPVAEHYQPPAPDQQAPQQQWPSYDAPAAPASPAQQGGPINEAATVTTPAVEEPADQEPEALTIGRGRGNSIVLDDMLVSRQHVRITADADGLVLEDLGSRNGTYVNGRRVERTHLSEGDRIGIGAATFEVRDGWLLNV